MTPTLAFIGAVVLAMLALAQRILDYQNRMVGRALVIASGGLAVLWCFLALPVWVGVAVAVALWSICLWFIFIWTQDSVVATLRAERQELGALVEEFAGDIITLHDRLTGHVEGSKIRDEIISAVKDDANITRQRAETWEKEMKSLVAVVQQHIDELKRGQTRIQFHQSRYNRAPIAELLSRKGSIYIITHVAGTLVNLEFLKSPVVQLIIQDPDGMEIQLLAQAVTDRTVQQLRDQIRLSIDIARQNRVDVRTFDGPLTSIILGYPSAGNGWAQVEIFLPQTAANDRPSVFFEERDYPQAFQSLLNMFKDVWRNGKRPT